MNTNQAKVEYKKSKSVMDKVSNENISLNHSQLDSKSTIEILKNQDLNNISIEQQNGMEQPQIDLIDIKKQAIQDRRTCRYKSNVLIIFVGLCHGLLAFIFLPSFIYQKEKLGLPPAIVQTISSLIIVPWCFKMFFGYVIDRMLQKFQRRKTLLLISYIARSLIMILFAFLSPSVFFFVIIVVFINLTVLFENIIAEYTAVIETKKLSTIKESQNENQMPLFYGARAIGTLVGTYFGGRALTYFTVQQCYMIYAVFPLILFLLTLLYQEDEIEQKRSSFLQDLKKMRIFLFKKNILYFMLFVFIVNLTPNFDSIVTFYLQDHLHFRTKDLADLSAFAALCYIIGLLLYYFVYKRWDPVKFFKRTLVFQLIANLLFLLVVFNIIQNLRLNSKFFCMFSQGAQALVSELNFMPVLAIWTYNCPENLEATSITVFTGFYHICQVFSGLFGALLIWIWHVQKTDYNKLWILIVAQNTYLLIVIISLLFLKFPKVNIKKTEDVKEEEHHELSENRMLKANTEISLDSIKTMQLILRQIIQIIMVKFSLEKSQRYLLDCRYYALIHIAQLFIVFLLPIILIFSSRQSYLKRFLVSWL